MFGRKKEKEVRVLIEQHLTKVAGALDKMTLTLQEYLKGDIVQAKENGFQTHLQEEEADAKRREIIAKLHKGAFLPVFREDLIKLVAQQDKIADRAESCCDFCLTQRPDIPDAHKDGFGEILVTSVKTFEPYKKALGNMFSDYDAVKTNIKDVNCQEEAADKLEWHLTRQIFSSDIDLARKMHLRDFIFHIVCISDIIEDATDDLDILMVKFRMS